MKRLLLIALGMWSVMTAAGQTPVEVVFGYDSNGNRTGNEIRFCKEGCNHKGDPDKRDFLSSVSDTFGAVDFAIYPNPTHDKVNIAIKGLETNQSMRAVLITADGKVLEEKNVANTVESFDLSGKTPGVYLLELYVDDERQVWKVIKQ